MEKSSTRKGMIQFSKVLHNEHPDLVRQVYDQLKFKPYETVESDKGILWVSGVSELFDELKEDEIIPEYGIEIKELIARGKGGEMKTQEYSVTRIKEPS